MNYANCWLPQLLGGMCKYQLKCSTLDDIPHGLADILKIAFDAAGYRLNSILGHRNSVKP